VRTFYGQKAGILQMRTSALFDAKHFGFFEIYGVSARTRGRVEPVRTFCGQGEGVFLQMRTSALFNAKKNFGFFEIYGVSARTRERGVEPVRTFFGQEERGQIFAILCVRRLWLASY